MFVFIPADGWPAIIDQEPDEDRLSDLMNAIPVHTTIGRGLGMTLEETQDGPLNLAASYLVSVLYGQALAVHGPVAVVGVDEIVHVGDHVIGQNADLTRGRAQAVVDTVTEALYADRGLDDKIRPSAAFGVPVAGPVKALLVRKAISFIREEAGAPIAETGRDHTI